MSALTAIRYQLVLRGTIKKVVYQLLSGKKAYENGVACIDTANLGYVTPQDVSTTLIPIGHFTATVDATSGAQPVGVSLFREKDIAYYDSVTGGGAVTSANMFQQLYLASGAQVTTVSTGASTAGRMWAISPQGYPNAIGVEAPWGI